MLKATIMKTTIHYVKKFIKALLLFVFLFSFKMNAQDDENKGISVYQYRQVQQDQMEEFIARETKYWSKVAESAIAKGNLTFWGLFEKVGGFDMPNSPNILFINTYKDIDNANMGEIWNPSAVWPNVPMDQMETSSMSKVNHMLFVKPEGWVKASNAEPENDYKFIKMIYHNASNPGNLVALEDKHWGPFIQSAMDSGKNKQKAWGNSRILSPSGPEMKANTISVDIYSTLKETLDPTWDENTVFPTEGLTEIMALETDQRISFVYRIVKVVTAPQQ
ncbi:hypothetical protein SAMN04488514_103327 [Kriegella aquimaris]|uniref:Uncharacterized protein n=2 Tax=Kriegella aquimaris TaxID=192904 RepID=A0A1G9NUE7_9FLAO|nr:hypothetical protein SAMN04488514_103327 [Kriegella aquimaris]